MLHCLHSSFDQKKWKNSVSKPSAITKRDMVQLWRVCTVIFFGCSLAPLEVFKGVKFMHITLSLTAFTTVCKCITHGRGSSTSLLLGILFLTLVPDTLLY